ncbi:type VI secretion system tip protein VgrG [Teredinibacter haidensis]|uniref:type VI secretion system tip protein VgrG n=1 Tax=Teredinibacter haidensis TaxID=2731755 RepID=UPI000948F232|nr:type VI secretion system tip protein VgrG [Teredinibacter haidensis]
MVDSPKKNSSDAVSIVIKIDGDDKTGDLKIESVRVSKAVNRIAKAWIHLIDGDMPSQTFPISDKSDLSPGNKVDIEVGYGSESSAIFSGIIVKHGIEIGTSTDTRLVIECADEAIKMTFGRKHANFISLSSGDVVKDSEVISTIVGNYSGLTADIETTDAELSSLVQYGATDWDFILSRAEVNNMLVISEEGKISVKTPKFTSMPILTVTYGIDIMDFRADLDSRFQLSQVTSTAWDSTTMKVVEETVTLEPDSSARATKNGNLSTVLGVGRFTLKTSTPQVQKSLKSWSTAQLTKSKLSLLRGHVKFQGNATPKLGEQIKVVGVGERFSGNVFCSAIEHRIENGSWITDVEFGCSPHWFTDQQDITYPKAAGLVPAFEGLQIGVVLKLDEDPEGQYRVKVDIPLQQATEPGIWARLSHPYASAGFGSFFIPEIGDEVVLGYFSNDPGYPVILGSLYSKKNTSPLVHTAENHIKTLITKSKLKIQFDDENKILQLETPGGQSVTLDDDQENVVVTDSSGNTITMSSSGIDLDSSADISLNAGGKISLTAGSSLECKATSDAKISGMNVSLDATTAFSASGNASSELKASGTTTVKGAMVMIN